MDLVVAGDDDHVLGLVDDRLRSFRSDPKGVPGDEIRVSFTAVVDTQAYQGHSHRGGRPVYDPPAGEIVYYDDGDQLHMNHDQVTSRADLATGRVDTWFRGDDPTARWLATHPFLTLSLMELLRRRHRYCLHAAACAVGGSVVLIAGHSGAGKSTLALALVRSGAQFLGDDTVFLSPDRGELAVLAFPDEVDLTDTTASMFSELSRLVGQPKPPGAQKHRLRAEDAFGDVVVMSGRPAAMVFPTIEEGEHSWVMPMPISEVLLELMPNVLLTEPRTAQAHLDVLGQLARSCPAFRLTAGSGVQELSDVVLGLLAPR